MQPVVFTCMNGLKFLGPSCRLDYKSQGILNDTNGKFVRSMTFMSVTMRLKVSAFCGRQPFAYLLTVLTLPLLPMPRSAVQFLHGGYAGGFL